MYAVKSGNLEMVQILVAFGACIHLQDSEGKTIFDIWPKCEKFNFLYQELLKTFLNSSNDNLDLDSDYPGVVFSKPLITKKLDSSELTIGSIEEMGVSISILADSLNSATNISICPCFSGPFELPDEYESASPAYLIHHDKMDLQKDVTIRMHHYASLQSEEDCEDMAFLSASSTPEYRGSRPVYIFKEIQGAKGVFRPGDQVGEISLRHFCFTKAARKRKREAGKKSVDESKKRHQENCYYSARLYRNIKHQGDVSAVFCMCLYDPVYIKHSDAVIARGYSGMSAKEEGRSEQIVQILEDKVEVNTNTLAGMHIEFDKAPAQILKRDIHMPEIMSTKVSEITDYPPKLSLYVQQLAPTISTSESPVLYVHGLDISCCFNNLPIISGPPQAAMSATSSTSNLLECNTPSPPPAPLDSVMTDNDIGIDDLSDVLDAVESLPARWQLLSIKLGLKESKLDIIELNNPSDVQTCLYKALGEWLKLNYDHQRHRRPSWRRLVEAVKSMDGGLAEKIIAEKHLA